MKREIKFRGKTNNGEWLVGEIISLNSHKYIAPLDGDWFDFIEWVPENVFHAPDSDKYEVDKDSIGQFTGLHDKNGKEIYEGDIVRRMYEIEIGKGKNKHIERAPVMNDTPKVIDFRNGAFGYVNDPATKYSEEEWIPILDQECEVIGNIHENFNLLQQ